jgi:group I intron endonuclease
MINEIKALTNVSGIYKIISPTGKIYIGESVDLKTRCRCYMYPSKVKKQRAIYNSLIKHGVENHTFEIIELCDKEMLKTRERYYQEKYDSVENGLNCSYTESNSDKKKYSEETKKIMSEKASGINNHFYGKNHSIESLRKISESSSGKNNPNYGGKLHNQEYLKKQSISNSKKPIIAIDTQSNDQFHFLNSKECALFFNVNSSMVRNCKSKNWKLKRRYMIQDYTLIESTDINAN